MHICTRTSARAHCNARPHLPHAQHDWQLVFKSTNCQSPTRSNNYRSTRRPCKKLHTITYRSWYLHDYRGGHAVTCQACRAVPPSGWSGLCEVEKLRCCCNDVVSWNVWHCPPTPRRSSGRHAPCYFPLAKPLHNEQVITIAVCTDHGGGQQG